MGGKYSKTEGYAKTSIIPIERDKFNKWGVPKNLYYFLREGNTQHKTINIPLQRQSSPLKEHKNGYYSFKDTSKSL